MQFFKPENYFLVREALIKAGRRDLIGDGCDALISATPPEAALIARRKRANKAVTEGKYYHAIPKETEKTGYRPGRKTAAKRSTSTRATQRPPQKGPHRSKKRPQ
jgi:hypothetical protein